MSTKKLQKYYKNLAQIRLDLKIVLDDLAYQKAGGHIFYAVDNNVIILYSNPEGKREYAQIFDDEKLKDLKFSAYSLAEYIFKHLANEPLLTLPTLYTEFTYIFEAIWKDHHEGHKVAQGQLAELEALFKAYQTTLDIEELVAGMLRHCDTLCRYLVQDDASATDSDTEIQRIGELVDSNKLADIQSQAWFHDKPSLAALYLESKPWYEKLRKVRPDRPLHRILDDAKTLAYVALVNRALQAAGSKQKLYFITGDKGIHKVIAAESSNIKAEVPIRHPRIYRSFTKLFNYLDDKSVLQKELDAYSKMLDKFFMPLLLNADGNEVMYIANLEAIVKGGGASYQCCGHVDEKITAMRNDFFKIAALNQSIQNEEEKLKLWLQKILGESEELLVKIQASLKAKWESTYANFERVYLSIGMTNMHVLEALKLHRGERLQGWHRLPVPLVSYYRNGQPDGLFEAIRQELDKGNNAAIFSLLQTGEPLSKGKMYLICALIAAEASAWEQVKSFCNSAADYAEEDATIAPEAYYLYAVALRHHYTKCEQFKEAFDKLEQANVLWRQQHNDESNTLEAIRFEVERCHQFVVYYNYGYFKPICVDEELPEIPSLEDTWNTLLQLAEKLEGYAADKTPISIHLKRQIYALIGSLFIFIKLIENKEYYDESIVKKYVMKLSKLYYPNPEQQMYYVEVTIAFCIYIFDLGNNEHSQEKYNKLKIKVEESLSCPDKLAYEEPKRRYLLEVLKAKSKF
ncbi:MAG: hypothetical protein HOP02_08415 [Methylococcaceae bacterium]|nr:hypothetical protein [Methylococcaceae bacterium]